MLGTLPVSSRVQMILHWITSLARMWLIAIIVAGSGRNCRRKRESMAPASSVRGVPFPAASSLWRREGATETMSACGWAAVRAEMAMW